VLGDRLGVSVGWLSRGVNTVSRLNTFVVGRVIVGRVIVVPVVVVVFDQSLRRCLGCCCPGCPGCWPSKLSGLLLSKVVVVRIVVRVGQVSCCSRPSCCPGWPSKLLSLAGLLFLAKLLSRKQKKGQSKVIEIYRNLFQLRLMCGRFIWPPSLFAFPFSTLITCVALFVFFSASCFGESLCFLEELSGLLAFVYPAFSDFGRFEICWPA